MALSEAPRSRPILTLLMFLFGIGLVGLVVWNSMDHADGPTATAVDPTNVAEEAAAQPPEPAPDQQPLIEKSADKKPAVPPARTAPVPPAPTPEAPLPIQVVPPDEPVVPSPAAERPAPSAAPPVPVVDEHTYDAASADVLPPELVTPRAIAPLRVEPATASGVPTIEVIVNADGTVASAKATEKPTTIADTLLLVNAQSIVKTWKFGPALKDGQAVKYRLVIPLSEVLAWKSPARS